MVEPKEPPNKKKVDQLNPKQLIRLLIEVLIMLGALFELLQIIY